MRSLAMDAIQMVTVLTKASRAVPKKELGSFIGQGYGIFAGSSVTWAKLRFSPERARWISRELWHPQQRITQESDSALILELSFTDIRELTMDILRQGRHVEVLEPKELRDDVLNELRGAIQSYARQ